MFNCAASSAQAISSAARGRRNLGAPTLMKAQPWLQLGAKSPGGLTLPDAHPTPSQMYGPRGVFLNDDVLIVADSGNHRVLIWQQPLRHNQQPADVVLGQPDFYSEGEKLFKLPTAVGVYEGKLFVADSWHHRILVWNAVPEKTCWPDEVIGQESLEQLEANGGKRVHRSGFYWPYSFAYIHQRFYVTDTNNRRVLWWNGLPQCRQPPDGLLGQDSFENSFENRGIGVTNNSFRWPHGIAGNETMFYIADAGNHRVLGWQQPLSDRAADLVLGQNSFTTANEFAYTAQGASKLRFPYSLALENNLLAVADTANNRILLWSSYPRHGLFIPADVVIGQPDFDHNGENHWKAITPATLCWPYGIHLHKGLLAIADSGNNRVVIWQMSEKS